MSYENRIPKILMIILGKFPTDKAYGVTTSNTLASLNSLGFSATCLSYSGEKQPQNHYRQFNYKESRFAKLLRKSAYLGFSPIHSLFWKTSILLTLANTNKTLGKINPDLIWIRDGVLLKYRFIKQSQFKIILEIHNSVTNSLVSQVSKIRKDRIILAPISKIIFDELQNSNIRQYPKILSPMGINRDLFSDFHISEERQKSSRKNSVIIGYFGKINPNGHSKGIEDIFELAEYHKEIKYESKFMIVGIQDSDKPALDALITKRNLDTTNFEILSHMKHDQAIHKMAECDILILPEQKDENYVGSPIKGIEYAATGKPILAAKSKANKSLFNEEFQPFWYDSKNISGMHESLLTCIDHLHSAQYFNDSREFAKSRTWIERTRRLVTAAEELGSSMTLNIVDSRSKTVHDE